MPFIQNKSQGLAAGFGQGWNAMMNLYGKKLLAEREKRMEDQFNKQFELQKRSHDLEMQVTQNELAVAKSLQKRKDALDAALSSIPKDAPDYLDQVKKTYMLHDPGGKFMQSWIKEEAKIKLQKAKDEATALFKDQLADENRADQQRRTQENQEHAAKLKEQNQSIEVYLPDGRSVSVQRKNLGAVKEKFPGATIIKPNVPKMDKTTLTMRALKGDKEAIAILEKLQKDAVEIAKAQGENAVKAKTDLIDVDATSDAIITGRETLDGVKNTFGVAVIELVRRAVLKKDPSYNFLRPRIKVKAIQSTLSKQYAQRGAMGSFVKNLNKQLEKVESRMKDIQSRVGVRALDLPWRELRTRFVGSGHENVLAGYMKEISAEISKLSQGSTASVAQLSDTQQKEWDKIHDPSLSLKELLIVLDGTREMANMRLESTDEEIVETEKMLDNIRVEKGLPSENKSRFKIIKVE